MALAAAAFAGNTASPSLTSSREQDPSSREPSSGENSKIVPIATKTLDAANRPVWTHREFNWAWRNPFAGVFKRGNDYVTEQWSEEWLVGVKKAVEAGKESIKNVGSSLWAWKFADAGKHFLNAIAIGIKLAVNVEIANFIKGMLGALISTGKLAFHTVVFVGCLILGIATLPFMLCGYKFPQKLLKEALANLGFAAKDIVSIITSVGHAIPSWLPIVLSFVIPPVGIPLLIVKTLAKYTGIFDVAAYGGTAILLYSKAKMAQWTLKKGTATEDQRQEAERAVEAWQNLKKELNPVKSLEGATLATYAVHVFVTGAETAADIFLPGSGKLIKYGSYGLQGLVALGLAGAVYKNSRRESIEMDLEQNTLDPDAPILARM